MVAGAGAIVAVATACSHLQCCEVLAAHRICRKAWYVVCIHTISCKLWHSQRRVCCHHHSSCMGCHGVAPHLAQSASAQAPLMLPLALTRFRACPVPSQVLWSSRTRACWRCGDMHLPGLATTPSSHSRQRSRQTLPPQQDGLNLEPIEIWQELVADSCFAG